MSEDRVSQVKENGTCCCASSARGISVRTPAATCSRGVVSSSGSSMEGSGVTPAESRMSVCEVECSVLSEGGGEGAVPCSTTAEAAMSATTLSAAKGTPFSWPWAGIRAQQRKLNQATSLSRLPNYQWTPVGLRPAGIKHPHMVGHETAG